MPATPKSTKANASLRYRGAPADNEYSKPITQPDAIGGAQIVLDIHDEDDGGRGFTCRGIEQPIWSFATYDPFA
jgi:hypothetical protein